MAIIMTSKEWRGLFDAMRDPVFLHDKEFRLVLANRSYLERSGMSEAEVLGRPYWQVFPRSSGPLSSCLCALSEAIEKEEEIKLDTGEVFLSRDYIALDEKGHFLYSRHNLIDITVRKRSEDTLRKLNRALRMLTQCNQALVHAEDEQKLLAEICRLIVEMGGYLMSWVGFAEQDEAKSVRPVGQHGFEEGYLESAQISWADTERGRGPTGAAIRTGFTQINQNFLTDPRMAPWRESAIKRGYQSSIALPLKDGQSTFGALTMYASAPDAFDAEETSLLSELANDLAFGIMALRERARRKRGEERLRTALGATIRVISATVEKRDPYTAGHQRRVSDLARRIATEMNLAAERVDAIRMAGSIHDLGKIAVPAEILSKPTKLTDNEYHLIQAHSQVGFEILRDIDFPWPIARIVLEHHERMNGSGYPRGLKGDDVLLESRIMAVADTVEAMASHRPYRPAHGVDAALDEIMKNRGVLYDPDVANACLKVFRNGYSFPAGTFSSAQSL